MRANLPVIICAAALSAFSCGSCNDAGDAGFADIPAAGWAYGDTLRFTPDPVDSVVPGHLAVAVRHTGSYLYSNLWLEITSPVPGDTVLRVDTVNVPLADDFGRWYGRGYGVSFVTVDTLPSSYVFERGSDVTVRHIMRKDTVAGLEQIGLLFLSSEDNRK